MPARNAPGGNVQHIARADIYRLAEPLTSPQQLSEEEFSNRSSLIATMPLTDADFGARTITYRDTLQYASQPARLRYAVRFVNASGQKAAFSNILLVEPAGKIAEKPTSLSAEATQDAIRLRWQAPTANVDGSTPASLIGYFVYRSVSEKEPATRLNDTPVTGTEFADEFFEFQKDYFYFVRAVSAGLQTEPVESTESNIVKFRAEDTFAPSAPTAITLAAAPGMISIFFPVNPENDIAGYKIYRSTDRDVPLDRWTALTPDLIKTTTFQDTRVESGKTYFYYVTATDRFGNVSPASEIVSETAP